MRIVACRHDRFQAQCPGETCWQKRTGDNPSYRATPLDRAARCADPDENLTGNLSAPLASQKMVATPERWVSSPTSRWFEGTVPASRMVSLRSRRCLGIIHVDGALALRDAGFAFGKPLALIKDDRLVSM